MEQSIMNLTGLVIFGTSLIFTRDITKSVLITAAYGLSSFILNEDSKNTPIPAIQEIKVTPNVEPRPPGSAFVQNANVVFPPGKTPLKVL